MLDNSIQMTDNPANHSTSLENVNKKDVSAPANNLKIGNYILNETLGCGTFAKVKRAEHQQTGHQVAIKVLNRQKISNLEVAGKIRREIQNLKLFRHPHIIKMYEVINTSTDIFMVMEYVSGGELFDYIVKKGRLEVGESRKFFQQIISGVDYCHRHMVVHRDLKPENLLLDQRGNVKIADFGLSNMMKDGDFLDTSCGSPNYAAPEVISGKLYAGPEVDVWSCGVILFALLCGTLPFDDPHVPALFRKIKEGIFTVPSFITRDCSAIIHHMLQVDPIARATIAQIKDYAWFKDELPEYLFPRPGSLDVLVIDEEVVSLVCQKLKCTEQDVIQALEVDDQSNPLRIAYNLIVDNKISKHIGPPNSIDDFVYSSTPPASSWKDFENLKISPGGMTFNANLPRTNSTPPVTPHKLGGVANDLSFEGGGRKKRWRLGIRSDSTPCNIMNEVFKAMKRCGFEWKIINPFLVIARMPFDKEAPLRQVKVCIRLYEVDNKKTCLLDFQNVSSFKDSDLNNTHKIVTELENHRNRNPSASSEDSATDRENHEILEFFEICGRLIAELSQER